MKSTTKQNLNIIYYSIIILAPWLYALYYCIANNLNLFFDVILLSVFSALVTTSLMADANGDSALIRKFVFLVELVFFATGLVICYLTKSIPNTYFHVFLVMLLLCFLIKTPEFLKYLFNKSYLSKQIKLHQGKKQKALRQNVFEKTSNVDIQIKTVTELIVDVTKSLDKMNDSNFLLIQNELKDLSLTINKIIDLYSFSENTTIKNNVASLLKVNYVFFLNFKKLIVNTEADIIIDVLGQKETSKIIKNVETLNHDFNDFYSQIIESERTKIIIENEKAKNEARLIAKNISDFMG